MELIKDLSVAAITNAICKNFWFRQKTKHEREGDRWVLYRGVRLGKRGEAAPEAFIGLIKRKCLWSWQLELGLLSPSSSTSSSAKFLLRFRHFGLGRIAKSTHVRRYLSPQQQQKKKERCAALILKSFSFFVGTRPERGEGEKRFECFCTWHFLEVVVRPATWFDLDSFWLLGRPRRKRTLI